MKTIIGKDNYLFLINDASNELNIHYDSNYKISNINHYGNNDLKNYILVIFPDKSVICKNYLPDNFGSQYRPGLIKYRNILNDKLLDGYEILQTYNNFDNIFYKTDTHMTLLGTFRIINYFINYIIKKFDMDIKINFDEINIESKEVESLCTLSLGIGDLTWKNNCGDLILEDISDIYFYSYQIKHLYEIKIENEIKILNYDLEDITNNYINCNITWDIISKNIIKKTNYHKKYKILIFYDSFMINIIDLLLNIFNEVYIIKSIYNVKFINLIKPDYIFEFRVERFLI